MRLGNCKTNPSHYFEKHEINSIDAIKLLGVTTDRELNFTDHVAAIVRKIINQQQVVKRHKRLIATKGLCNNYQEGGPKTRGGALS